MGKSKDLLEKLELTPSKKKGQNYLLSGQDARSLVTESGITYEDVVIEIGPGLGALTKYILEMCREVHAIEIEKKVASHLLSEFANYKNAFHLYVQDFRSFDPHQLSEDTLYLISNIPYIYSTDALLWMIAHRDVVRKASLLLQKEFAERVSAKPGTKAYGSLSIYVQLFYKVRLGLILPGSAFIPKAAVNSQQIHLEATHEYTSRVKDIPFFEKVLRASFSMRRKMLMNCLLKNGLVASRIDGEKLFDSIGLSVKTRAEELSIEDFIRLANSLES